MPTVMKSFVESVPILFLRGPNVLVQYPVSATPMSVQKSDQTHLLLRLDHILCVETLNYEISHPLDESLAPSAR